MPSAPGTTTIAALAGVLLLLAGCAQTPAPDDGAIDSGAGATTAIEEPAAPEPEPEPEPRYLPIPEETLYALLVAEIGARRGELGLALGNYLAEARRTRDPAIAAQALRIARYMNRPQEALEAARIWARAEPQSAEARFMAATELARAGQTAEAFAEMQALANLGGETNFTAIAAGALDEPEAARRDMLGRLEALGEAPDVLVARALLAQSLGDNDGALALTARVLAADPGNYQAVLIEAQVFQNRGDTAQANARIDTALAAEPGNRRLRLHYARQLAGTDLAASAAQYRLLLAETPDDAELRLSLALVLREAKDYAGMREELARLVEAGRQQDAAHFYLGEDAEREGRTDEALGHYLAVGPSAGFGPALVRAARIAYARGGVEGLARTIAELRGRWPAESGRLVLLQSELLVEDGQLEASWGLLGEAIARTPDDTALLYARSLVAEKRRDIPALERDLREVLRREPDSAMALNALGYSLTNLTDRHEEARALIERALALKPGDPAILDSMGWVLFRLGETERALGFLEDAFSRLQDPEVAAHLGEVLWTLGRRDEAREAWRKGLEEQPDSPVILETLRRLGVEPAP